MLTDEYQYHHLPVLITNPFYVEDMKTSANIEPKVFLYSSVYHFLGCNKGGGGPKQKMERCDTGERGVTNIDFFQ